MNVRNALAGSKRMYILKCTSKVKTSYLPLVKSDCSFSAFPSSVHSTYLIWITACVISPKSHFIFTFSFASLLVKVIMKSHHLPISLCFLPCCPAWPSVSVCLRGSCFAVGLLGAGGSEPGRTLSCHRVHAAHAGRTGRSGGVRLGETKKGRLGKPSPDAMLTSWPWIPSEARQCPHFLKCCYDFVFGLINKHTFTFFSFKNVHQF